MTDEVATEVVTAAAVVASRAVPTSLSTQAVTLKRQDITLSREHMIIPLKLPVVNIMEELNSHSMDRSYDQGYPGGGYPGA